jgi:hypothetical protein
MVDQMLTVNFEVTKNDRKYVLAIPMNAPLGELYDCVHEMLQEVLKQAQASADKAKAVKEEAAGVVD